MAVDLAERETRECPDCGDYPSRVRIIVTDTSGNTQNSLVWGFRSRYYSAAATAGLFYEAEAMTPIGGASAVTFSGASGGHVVEQSSLPSGSWVSILSTTLTSGSAALTHQGSYRVWARVYTDVTDMQLQFLWAVGSLSVPATNDAVAIPGADAFYLVDLGTVRLDAPAVGTSVWYGVIQAYAAAGGAVCIDELFFQPLDEAAGELVYTSALSPSTIVTPAYAPSSVSNGSGSSPAVEWTEDMTTGAMYVAPITPESGGNFSYPLVMDAIGYTIPTACTILGIEVAINMGGILTYPGASDQFVQLLKAGSAVGSNLATFEPVDAPTVPGQNVNATRIYGGPGNLWGTTWTPAQINATGFGVTFTAGASQDQAAAMSVNTVRITVYYTYGGFSVAEDAVVYADEATQLTTQGMFRTPGSSIYGPVAQVTGDLPRLPPSGIEDRPAQLFVKPSRGDLNTLPDSGLDTFTVQVVYRPTWLSRP
jgi:hypothetical protein